MSNPYWSHNLRFEHVDYASLELVTLDKLFPSWRKHACVPPYENSAHRGRGLIGVWRDLNHDKYPIGLTDDQKATRVEGAELEDLATRLYTTVLQLDVYNLMSVAGFLREFGPVNPCREFWRFEHEHSIIFASPTRWPDDDYFARRRKRHCPDAVALEPMQTVVDSLVRMKAVTTWADLLQKRQYRKLKDLLEFVPLSSETASSPFEKRMSALLGKMTHMVFRPKWMHYIDPALGTMVPGQIDDPQDCALYTEIALGHYFSDVLEHHVKVGLHMRVPATLVVRALGHMGPRTKLLKVAKSGQGPLADAVRAGLRGDAHLASSTGFGSGTAPFVPVMRTDSLEALHTLHLLGRLGMPVMYKQCAICGGEFIVEHRSSMYCPTCSGNKALQKQVIRARKKQAGSSPDG